MACRKSCKSKKLEELDKEIAELMKAVEEAKKNPTEENIQKAVDLFDEKNQQYQNRLP